MRLRILTLVVALLAAAATPQLGSPHTAVSISAHEAIRRAVTERVGRDAVVTVRILDPVSAEPIFSAARPDASARLGAPIRFTLVPAAGGAVQVSASIAVSVPHVLVKQDIGRGHALDAAAIEVRRGELSGVPLVSIASPEEIQGARALRPLAAGTVVLTSFVALKPVIAPGDRVTVVALAGNIEVSAVMVAADGGRIGDAIRVRSADSKRYIRGRVVKAGLVEVIHDR